jgi:hypothetical protein
MFEEALGMMPKIRYLEENGIEVNISYCGIFLKFYL